MATETDFQRDAVDTEFWFAYAWGPGGVVIPLAVRAQRLCSRVELRRACSRRIEASSPRGGVAGFQYELVALSDRAEVSCRALDDVSSEVGEAFFAAMVGRSRALSAERWAKFRASLARGVAPYVVGGWTSEIARLAAWARKGLGDGAMWAPLANLFWWYRNRRGDDDLLSLVLRIRGEKQRLRGVGVSWSAVAGVARCLKTRSNGFECKCAMCRQARRGGGH